MITLTFLGTGTSTGIPALGCQCEVCHSTDVRDHRLRSSAILTTDTGLCILIDCGPDARQQLLDHHNSHIDAVLITHSHYDHVGGIDDLRTLSYPDAMDIYCRKDVDADLHRVMPYCFDHSYYANIPRLRLHDITPFNEFSIQDVTITPLQVIHGKLPILGYRINNLGYITDASYVPDETIEVLRGIDTLILNSLGTRPHPTHMSLPESLEVIDRIKPRCAYLTHISHQMGKHAETSSLLPHGVELAYDGLTISIH